jgi:hypothetical protein
MPTIPPTPWHGKTSRVSSSELLDLKCTEQLLTILATIPIIKLAPTLTNPAAGVIATSPTTAPIHAPNADGFLAQAPSKKIQASIAAADAVFVVKKALAANPLAAKADPALNPNQPNHNMPVPKRTYGICAGSGE